MKSQTFHIEIITPSFCGGAEPSKAELRPSAIRGQLRWWYRCLGGAQDQEKLVFGGISDGENMSSIFSVKIKKHPSDGEVDWCNERNIPPQGMNPKTYLLGFFCGRTGRLIRGGAIPPSSRATVELIFRKPKDQILEKAIKAFFSVGAVGFRSTRCAGAICSREYALNSQGWDDLCQILIPSGFMISLDQKRFNNWVAIISHAGEVLKDKLRSRGGLGISAGKANALGSAEPRQTSVLHLRPVKIDGELRLAYIEAPHNRILGDQAKIAHGNRGSIVQIAGL